MCLIGVEPRRLEVIVVSLTCSEPGENSQGQTLNSEGRISTYRYCLSAWTCASLGRVKETDCKSGSV